MKPWGLVPGTLVLLLLAGSPIQPLRGAPGAEAAGAPARMAQTLDRIMALKLDHFHEILKGLALEDFGLVEREGRLLGRLTEASGWSVLRTPEYRGQSADFLRGTEALVKAAQERKLDAATQEYVSLTYKCIECHKYVRRARLAERAPVSGPLAGTLPPAGRSSSSP